jgi:hypothetical protein
VSRAQQRRRAEPEDQDRHRQHGRSEQETEAGEHGREFHLRKRSGEGPLSIENAVTTELTALASERTAQRQRIRCFEDTATLSRRLLKISGANARRPAEIRFVGR